MNKNMTGHSGIDIMRSDSEVKCTQTLGTSLLKNNLKSD